MTTIARKKSNVTDYSIAIIVNIILLVFFSRLTSFNFNWLKDSAVVAVTLFQISFLAQILGNLILAVRDQGGLKHIIKIFLPLVSILPMYVLLTTYPFDFSKVYAPEWTDMLVKIFIILSMLGLVVAIISEITKIFQRRAE